MPKKKKDTRPEQITAAVVAAAAIVRQQEFTREELVQLTLAAAQHHGVVPAERFERQIEWESGGYDPDVVYCRRDSGAGAKGIAQIMQKSHPKARPCDPIAALDYAAALMAGHLKDYDGDWVRALVAYNAGPGFVQEWDGLPENLYDETQRYLEEIIGVDWYVPAPDKETDVTLPDGARTIGDLEIPVEVYKQTDDWTCSVRALTAAIWLCRTLEEKQPLSYERVYGAMVPQFANSSVGLRDGTGAGLGTVLAQFGYGSNVVRNASRERVFEAIQAGKPVLIGGHSWGPEGHWALAYGTEEDGTIVLANPAISYSLGGKQIKNEILTSWSKSPWDVVIIDAPRKKEVVEEEELDTKVRGLLREALRLLDEYAAKKGIA